MKAYEAVKAPLTMEDKIAAILLAKSLLYLATLVDADAPQLSRNWLAYQWQPAGALP